MVGTLGNSTVMPPVIEPEVSKLDMHLVRHPDSAVTQETCRVIRAAARCTGAVVVAEGIPETTMRMLSDFATVTDIGRVLLQRQHGERL
jgi:hypothetical protein